MTPIAAHLDNAFAQPPRQVSPSIGTTQTRPDSAAPDRWVDALLLRLHAIYAGRWEKHIESVPYSALKAEWARALVGLTGQQIAAGLDACRQVRTWPPVPAEFRADCLGGSNAEQRAFEARAEQPPAALTHGTYADTRDAGQKHMAAILAGLGRKAVTRTEVNIRNGSWTAEHEQAWRANLADMPWLNVPEIPA